MAEHLPEVTWQERQASGSARMQVAAAGHWTGWDQAHADVPCIWTGVTCTPGFVATTSASSSPGSGEGAPFVDLDLSLQGLQGEAADLCLLWSAGCGQLAAQCPSPAGSLTVWSACPYIQSLQLDGNAITGPLPASGALAWPVLKTFSIAHSSTLQSTLPPEWGDAGSFPRCVTLLHALLSGDQLA